jgi:CheY-like chemotaxis protein
MTDRKRIVVVEDDDSIRLVTRLTLESLGGWDVAVFPGGEDVLQAAPGLQPDLLVLDVSMPGLDGPQTLALLRRLPHLEKTPVVFLTASTQPGQVAILQRLGARDIIAKPFDPQHLCERITAALAAPRDGAPAARPARTALLVEDDPGVRYLVRFILEQQGWGVIEADTGPGALTAIHRGEVADAVLLDIMLPGIDGLELLDVLRASPRWTGVPVMMLTARGDEAAVKRALSAGAADYLGKPFDPAELVSRLERLPLRG